MEIPKVELHVHLEGSITPNTIRKIIENENSEISQFIPKNEKKYKYSGASGFFSLYPKICSVIQTPKKIEFITREFLKQQKQQNIVYSEVFYSPQLDIDNFSLDEQLKAIENAINWANRDLNTHMSLIIDVNRGLELRKIE